MFSPKALKDFHGRVIDTFDHPLSAYHPLKDVVGRIIMLVAAIVLYPLLITTALISIPFKCCCGPSSGPGSGYGSGPSPGFGPSPGTSSAASTIFAPKTVSKLLFGPPKPSALDYATHAPSLFGAKEGSIFTKVDTDQSGPAYAYQFLEEQPKAHYKFLMQNIREKRRDDYESELNRLRSSDILTPEIEARLNGLFGSGGTKALQSKFIYGRILEIKQAYSDPVYVFTHAQATISTSVTYLIKELVRQHRTDREIKLFKFLRAPESKPYDDEKLILDLKAGVADDHRRDGILSVDGYLYSSYSMESALHFFRSNSNIFSGYKEVITKILKGYLPPKLHALIPSYVHELEKINEDLLSFAQTGNIFAICVPKSLVELLGDKVVYRSHAFGKACLCHPGQDPIKILHKIQNDQLDDSSKCKPIGFGPQYRFLTSELTPENGIHIHYLTPFGKAKRKEVKGKIKELVSSMVSKAKK